MLGKKIKKFPVQIYKKKKKKTTKTVMAQLGIGL